jgi:hypothetical protein
VNRSNGEDSAAIGWCSPHKHARAFILSEKNMHRKSKSTDDSTLEELKQLLKQQDLGSYVVAAEKAQISCTHLLEAACLASTHPAQTAEKGIRRLFDELGMTSPCDQRKLRLCLLQLRHRQPTLSMSAPADLQRRRSTAPTSQHARSSLLAKASLEALGNPCFTTSTSWAYASMFGNLAVKCVVRRTNNVGFEVENERGAGQLKSTELKEAWHSERDHAADDDDDDADYDDKTQDVSILQLDVSKPLQFADLLCEIHRVHGHDIAVKIRYEDKDGDLVSVRNDDSLRYAHDDWLRSTKTEPQKSWRLLVELEHYGTT